MRGLSSTFEQIIAISSHYRDMGWSRRIIWALCGALAAVAVISLAALAGSREAPTLGDRVDLDRRAPSVVSTQTATSTPTTSTPASSPPDSSPGSSVVAPTTRAPVRVPLATTCDDDDCDDDDDDGDDDDEDDDDDE